MMFSRRKNNPDAVAVMALALGLVASLRLAETPANANVTLDVSEVSLAPSASPQNFFLNLSLTNNAVTSVNLVSWQFKLNFTPAFPASDLQLTGASNNIFPSSGVGLNPPALSFVTVSVFANGFTFFTPVPLAGGATATLVNINFQLSGNAMTNFYNVAITNAEIGYSDFTNEVPVVGTGSIATPEPGAGMLLLAAAGAVLRRRRRRGLGSSRS